MFCHSTTAGVVGFLLPPLPPVACLTHAGCRVRPSLGSPLPHPLLQAPHLCDMCSSSDRCEQPLETTPLTMEKICPPSSGSYVWCLKLISVNTPFFVSLLPICKVVITALPSSLGFICLILLIYGLGCILCCIYIAPRAM